MGLCQSEENQHSFYSCYLKGPWNDVLPSWKQNPTLLGNEPLKPINTSIAQYTGGEVTIKKDLSSVSLGPNPMPELAHVIIGIESPCHQVTADFCRRVPLSIYCPLPSNIGA